MGVRSTVGGLVALALFTQPVSSAATASGFLVCGKAGERPGANAPLARFVFFTLNPSDVTVFSTSSGIFCFEHVAPGDYTISVHEYVGAPSSCTEYGCWPDTPVTVIDADIENIFLTMQPLSSSQTCQCLQNGGRPGPGDCPCDVGQCFNDCAGTLCPGTPNCMVECSIRCSCNSAPGGCATHVDPGPTPTSAPQPPCVGDGNGDHRVTIEELVGAIANALNGCP